MTNAKALTLWMSMNSIWENERTIFLLFMRSSIGFFFGITRLIRDRSSDPNILLIMCNTSSDDLIQSSYWKENDTLDKMTFNIIEKRPALCYSNLLKMIRAVNIVDVMNSLLQMIGCILDLLEFPWWFGIYCCTLRRILCPLNLKTDLLQRTTKK